MDAKPLRQDWQIFLLGLLESVKVEGLAGPAMGDVGKVSSAHNVAGESLAIGDASPAKLVEGGEETLANSSA